ncbi:hypothetical protein [Aureimonas glaciei]|uniref:Uncharacterized protein n=1 Tax=Aureimonas glaciei TaxID=1776957 RepID=A0A916YG74_9HYPH|nr:hypothetical protein [Aureimonas glaciei]GGD43429.1 hypothetical protein GCM10011335_52560 [Aureimonas glaciei]
MPDWVRRVKAAFDDGADHVGAWLSSNFQLLLTVAAVSVSVYTAYVSVRVSETVYLVGFRLTPPAEYRNGKDSESSSIGLTFQAINAGNRPAIIERVFVSVQKLNEKSCKHPSNDDGKYFQGKPADPSDFGFLKTVILQPGSVSEVSTSFPDLPLAKGSPLQALCLLIVGYDFQGKQRFGSTHVANVSYYNVQRTADPQRLEFIK